MRMGGGGGYGAITGRTYTIRTMAVTPESASGYTASEIQELFSYLDPGAAAQAGAAHTAAGQTLASIADDLVKHVQVLNESWSGTSAQSAIGSFQQLHQTAVGLAQASAQTGAVLSWLGETILPYYKNYKAPGNGIVGDLESLVGHNPQNSAAQAVMERLNNRFTQANAGLPPSVSVSLPANLGGHSSTATSSVGSAGAGAGHAASGVSGLAGGGSSVGSLAGGGAGAGSGVGGAVGALGHGGSSGSVTRLASSGPPGGTSGSGPGGGPLTGGSGPTVGTVGPGGPPGSGSPAPGGSLFPISGGSGPSGGPEGPGPLGNAGGESLGAEGAGLNGEGVVSEGMVGVAPGDGAVMGADGMIGMAPDPSAEGLGGGLAEGGIGAGDAAAAGTVGADGAMAGGGMTGLPMMGGSAAGRQESERRRQAWMAEDADVWEAAANLVPALIGA
jgi:uncharacterized protein YukE